LHDETILVAATAKKDPTFSYRGRRFCISLPATSIAVVRQLIIAFLKV